MFIDFSFYFILTLFFFIIFLILLNLSKIFINNIKYYKYFDRLYQRVINVYLFKEPIYYINNMIFLFILFWLNIIFIIYSYINSDLAIINIIKNSNVLEALLYKFTGFWGNQDGSYLLWIFFLFIYLIILIFNTDLNKLSYIYKILLIQSYHIVFFIFILIFCCNLYLKGLFFINMSHQLNPILQDPTFAIHPPFLYFGYLGSSILFSMGFIIFKNKILPHYYIFYFKLFTLITWSTLTLGIGLGSWWAYYELGWGGWWFWDPVENISLIPWLLITALLHNLILNKKYNYYFKWTILYSIFTYIFCILGTYLIRSGILTSVHSFAQDNISSQYLFIYLFILLLWIFFFKQNILFLYNNVKFIIFSKQYFIKYMNILFLLGVIILIFTLLFPLGIYIFSINEISFTNDFYNEIYAPFLIPLILLMTLSSVFPSYNKIFHFDMLYYKFFSLGTIIYFLIYLIINQHSPSLMMIILTTLILWSSINILILIIKLKLINSMILAHLSINFFFFSIIINIYFQWDLIHMIHPGEKLFFEGYNFIFRNLHLFDLQIYRSFLYDLFIEKNNTFINIIFPEQRFYLENKLLTFKPYVYSNLFSDIYFILGDGNIYIGWYLKLIFNPLMTEIWISIILLIYAGLIGINYCLTLNKNIYKFY